MKTRILTAVLAMVTVMAFGQKREVRKAGDAVEEGNFEEAKNYLSQVEPQLADLNDRFTRDYYLYKGQAYLGEGATESVEDLLTAAEAFNKAKEFGADEAQLAQVSNALVNSAIADQEQQDFSSASEKLKISYDLNKQDTLYLYYAASNAVNAKEYDKALEYYHELRDLGFTGVETEYTAVNEETGEVEVMNSKEERDIFIKSGDYTDPGERQTPPKTGEIAKNIALIYIENGEHDKAIAAMEEAVKENPEDTRLRQAEADLYYQMEDMEKYREIMEEIVALEPENPVLFYNLGVSAYELGETEKAIEYYKKVLELDPEMTNARLNLAQIILSKEQAIVEEMNSLGTSDADNQRYDELSDERRVVYREALPYLEEVLEDNPNHLEAARTMMNIYYQLDEAGKAEEMEQRISEIRANQ